MYFRVSCLVVNDYTYVTAHVHHLESGNNEEQANGCCKSTRRRVEAVQRLRVAQWVMLQE